MNANEISKLAHAINELRPDWPTSSLKTWITNNLGRRSFRDAAVALVWVALDIRGDGSYATDKPARVLEAGPWWRAAAAGEQGDVVPRNPSRDEACPVCSRFAGSCACTREELDSARRPPADPTRYVEQIRASIGAGKNGGA